MMGAPTPISVLGETLVAKGYSDSGSDGATGLLSCGTLHPVPASRLPFRIDSHATCTPMHNHPDNIPQHFATPQYTPCCGRQRLRLKDGSRAPELVDVLSSAQVAGSHAKLVIEIKPFNEFAAAPLCKLFAERPVSAETACTIAVPTAPAHPTTPNSAYSYNNAYHAR